MGPPVGAFPALRTRFAAWTAAARARAHCDAVLEIQDIGAVGAPFFIYQDVSYDVLAAEFAKDASGARTCTSVA